MYLVHIWKISPLFLQVFVHFAMIGGCGKGEKVHAPGLEPGLPHFLHGAGLRQTESDIMKAAALRRSACAVRVPDMISVMRAAVLCLCSACAGHFERGYNEVTGGYPYD